MTEVFRFALLGLGAGGLYALAAIGLVLVFRGSGVVNFAQGAMGMVAAYVFYELHVSDGAPVAIAVIVGLLASALLGTLYYMVVMRRNHGRLQRHAHSWRGFQPSWKLIFLEANITWQHAP